MRKPRNEFHEAVQKALKCAEKLVSDFEILNSMCESGQDIEAFQYSFGVHGRVCKLFKISNYLPAFTGDSEADKLVEEVLREEIPIDIGYTKEGWFLMRMPLLLPKKETGKGDVKHLRAILGASFKQAFAAELDTVKFRECTIIYRHVYAAGFPDRKKRDHDNIETNEITDAIALFVMTDDAPKCCQHHHCSAAGPVERTEVYVVPEKDFIKWYEASKNFPSEGVKLHGQRSIFDEKTVPKPG